jgi:DNA (cytosine-5)-methyltransferase 1
MNENLNVVELFAGVGGFRVGLERADKSYFLIHLIYKSQ